MEKYLFKINMQKINNWDYDNKKYTKMNKYKN